MPHYKKLQHQISAGWPEHRLKLDPYLKPYHHHNLVVTYPDRFLLKGKKNPSTLSTPTRNAQNPTPRPPGNWKTKSQPKQSLFWPNMNANVKCKISNCEACQQYKNHQGDEPLKNHEIPDKPWTKVGTNLFQIQGTTNFIFGDYYSKYFKICKLLNNTSTKKMKARHGIPQIDFSDNGLEFTSLEIQKILNELGFRTWHL